jgi:hypothetical protein
VSLAGDDNLPVHILERMQIRGSLPKYHLVTMLLEGLISYPRVLKESSAYGQSIVPSLACSFLRVSR